MEREEGLTRYRTGVLAVAVALSVVACGDAPLASMGQRSSGWINEPEVTTTIRHRVETPRLVPGSNLRWFNDDIVTESLSTREDRDAIVAEVFGRREGDRFIQASRFEIAAVVPDIEFPTVAPYTVEWVSSQLVLENNGRLSAEPTVAFGFWSSVPYRASRSVAQLAVLRVSNDPTTAEEVRQSDAALSCGRFAERDTDECILIRVEGKDIWKLISASGTTLIWFGGPYRYELFGRLSVPADVLEEMAAKAASLAEVVFPETGD